MIRATQFSSMGGPVGDPWIWVYPQHWQWAKSWNIFLNAPSAHYVMVGNIGGTTQSSGSWYNRSKINCRSTIIKLRW